MANIKSQIKRNRQNEKRRLRNRNFRGAARTAVKTAHASLADGTQSSESVMAAVSALDRAAQKGSIHPRNAARRKSRLMKRLNKAGAAPQAQKTPAKGTSKQATAKKSSK